MSIQSLLNFQQSANIQTTIYDLQRVYIISVPRTMENSADDQFQNHGKQLGCTAPIMCHQVSLTYRCGHSTPARVVICARPANECQDLFLRPLLQSEEELCAVSNRLLRLGSRAKDKTICKIAAASKKDTTE